MGLPEHLVDEHIRLTRWRRKVPRAGATPITLSIAERQFEAALEAAVPDDVKAVIRAAAERVNAEWDYTETDRFTLDARMLAPVIQHLRLLLIAEAERRGA